MEQANINPGANSNSSADQRIASKNLTAQGACRYAEVAVSTDWNSLVALATDEVESTLAGLPPELRERAVLLPITFEPCPNEGLIEDGIEPDTLGLFVGPEFAEEGTVPMPPQIILFLENLWDTAEEDKAVFCEEVRTTLLHELGHYLGLNEDDLFDRGLE